MAKNPKKQPNKILAFSSMGLEMGLTIFLAAKLGAWLDTKYPNNKNYFTLTTVVIAFIASMYILIKKLNKMQE